MLKEVEEGYTLKMLEAILNNSDHLHYKIFMEQKKHPSGFSVLIQIADELCQTWISLLDQKSYSYFYTYQREVREARLR